MRGIITADWHLREDKPRCRIDEDWIGTQKKALERIYTEAGNRNYNVYVVGDLFHRSTEYRMVRLVQQLAEMLDKDGLHLYFLAGNHDCLYHLSSNLDRSAIGLLQGTKNVYFMNDLVNVSAPNFGESVNKDMPIVFEHRLVFPDKKSLPPNVEAITAEDMLEMYPNAEWIFTGDYHHNFHYEKNGRHVVNSGCLLRQATDMKNYDCGFYCVNTDISEVEWISVGDNEPLVDDSYIIKQEEREERLANFIDSISKTTSISLDYLDNVQKALLANDIPPELKEMINEIIQNR